MDEPEAEEYEDAEEEAEVRRVCVPERVSDREMYHTQEGSSVKKSRMISIATLAVVCIAAP